MLDVARVDVAKLIGEMEHTSAAANLTLACLRKMFSMAEVWGYRPDGGNPTRHIPKFPQKGSTRLITNAELKRLFAYLDRAVAEGLEQPFLTLAIRLQFAFAARRSEILLLEWSWTDCETTAWSGPTHHARPSGRAVRSPKGVKHRPIVSKGEVNSCARVARHP